MSGRLGIGAMIQMLGVADGVEAWKASEGRIIAALEIDPDANGGDGALRFTFDDGSRMEIVDNARSCCESRYMVTDDDLSYHVGAILLDAEVREAPNEPDEWDVHEVAFLDVMTSKGVLQVRTHNVHNGYYGGFWVKCRALPDIEGASGAD